MAVFPKIIASTQASNPAASVDIAARTEQATHALNAVTLASPGGVAGTSGSLAIDLDEHAQRKIQAPAGPAVPVDRPRREPLRRDSLKRREALLKGKEGSRRRTRWENDRLLSNPWAQPPLPSDWEVHPTYPRYTVPYFLAPLWDQGLAAKAEAKEHLTARRHVQAKDKGQGQVPRELREKLKKAKAAKGLLKDLEEQVRVFIKNWEDKTRIEKPELDSEDEEIVFVGRNGHMHDMPSPKFGDGMNEEHIERDRLVFDSLANDQRASFG
ncbi:MAG: hypothetical protein Q9163_001764 [Psora crenata]